MRTHSLIIIIIIIIIIVSHIIHRVPVTSSSGRVAGLASSACLKAMEPAIASRSSGGGDDGGGGDGDGDGGSVSVLLR